MRTARFKHELADSFPEKLQAGILYVAKDGDVAGHLCACGCGREVITPLSSTDWSIAVDRLGATLDPSIGNWAFPCRSHYIISDGEVVWAGEMSAKSIARGRQRDKSRKQTYYKDLNAPPPVAQETVQMHKLSLTTRKTCVQRLSAWWKSLFTR
jgi:hypothetical protein